MTLLPEASSARVIRALGRFFGAAAHATDGRPLDFKTATPGKNDTVKRDPGGSKTVYLGTSDCVSRVYAAS